MTYARLSDDHFDREKVIGLSRSAALLDVEGLVYCNRLLTDGRLPANALRRVTNSPDPVADAAELVKAGVWTVTDGGWLLDWTHQRTAEKVIEERVANAARKQAYDER